MFVIVKVKDNKIQGYLYETHSGRYIINKESANVCFNTPESAINFMHNNSSKMSSCIKDDEQFIVINTKTGLSIRDGVYDR